MMLSVYVRGRAVATLEGVGDFKSMLTYHANVAPDNFVSLTMPVRTEPYIWDDTLHPIFQMNLPEGYLLQVLQEQFGPHIGANPVALLSIIGRNMVGRVQVAASDAALEEPPKSIEVAELLEGDYAEEAFAELVRQHATSGVSGIFPKFLDAQQEKVELQPYKKATLFTRRHIIKGSSRQLPYVALNEYFCMQVAAQVLPAAKTEISRDGQVLIVHRFDVDEFGQLYWGMEDFCALLGLRSAAKYDPTWERIAKAVRDHAPGIQRRKIFYQLAVTLLLTYALRNADCHAKNLALLYTSHGDVHLSPVYDMLTTCVYPGYQYNSPALSFMGKKTWLPGKNLQKFISATFGIALKEQTKIVEAISDAISAIAPRVREAISLYPGFSDIGKRMLIAWHEGVMGLRNQRVYALSDWVENPAFKEFSMPSKLENQRIVIGRSDGLGKR